MTLETNFRTNNCCIPDFAGLVIYVLVFLSLPCTPFANGFIYKVAGDLDGDTIKVLHNGKAQRIRLQGIDCPEKGHAFGKVDKWATSVLVFGRTVTIQTHDTDKYKRVVTDVVLGDGTKVDQKLVKDNWCWWYR